MFEGKSICVTVPCYNEETQIRGVVESMPTFVDRICIVDDKSKDRTVDVVRELQAKHPRVTLLKQKENAGVGAAIGAGYLWARENNYDVTVVMAGDGQMDPRDLERVITPVVRDEVDYCKGNRFKYPDGLSKIPRVRKFGNFLLSALTKIASGYWHVTDSQTGYTAISLNALWAIAPEKIYPRYGCPNDILVKLNIAGMRVGEVPVNPLYGVGEQSKLHVRKVAGPIIWLVLRLWAFRIFRRYVIENGHPIIGVLLMALLAGGLWALTLVYVIVFWAIDGVIPKAALIVNGVSFITSAQFLLNAFQQDYEYNSELCVMLRGQVIRPEGEKAAPKV
ncbi:MAG: glycosyltransferase family 2 protein [Planctomycetes bacterium]|nr:glycosyltransferase family 2 protein [Planctomycetota bacterium]